jgi:hypothetical protein
VITRPEGMTLHDWADRVVLDLDGRVGRLLDNDWKAWGSQLLLSGIAAPSPLGFNDWRDWANRLSEALG